jgi:hypothetical protein
MKRITVLLLVATSIGISADQLPFVAMFTSLVPGGALPVCDAAHPVPVALVGTGHATHMGRFTETQTHCVNPTTGEFSSGQFTTTGANGDAIFGTYSGHVVPTTATTGAIYGVFVITGGTGRFVGATGGGGATGTLDFVTGEANDLLLKGTISRPHK